MEEEAKKLKNYPYLMVLESAEAINFVVMVEREAFVETETFNSALLYLFAAYYVFNIAYPKGCYSVFIFLQKYVLAVGSEDKLYQSQSVRLSQSCVDSRNLFNFISTFSFE